MVVATPKFFVVSASRTAVALLCLGSLLLSISQLQARMTSSNYILEADVLSSGGREDSTSSSYGIRDTIGEGIILSATSTSANYGYKAGFRELFPEEFLTFSVPATAVSLGQLSSAQVTSATQTFSVETNAANGFSVTVSGTTLTSGANTVTEIGATAAASAPGAEQFGMNLVANTGFGASPSGTSPLGSAANQFNEANKFTFTTGATIATSTSPIGATTFTISYIANTTGSTESGSYSTTLTYSATASF